MQVYEVKQIDELVKELEESFCSLQEHRRKAFIRYIMQVFPSAEAFERACNLVWANERSYAGGFPEFKRFKELYLEDIQNDRPEYKVYKVFNPEEHNLLPPSEESRGVNRSEWVGCTSEDIARLRAKLAVSKAIYQSPGAQAIAGKFRDEVTLEAKARGIDLAILSEDSTVGYAKPRHLRAV